MNKGFTLLELLMTMAIVGTLVTLGVIGYGNQIQKALDAERKSDLKQYETALQSYSIKSGGVYPVRSGSGVDVTTLCGNAFQNIACQDDPDATQNYIYTSDAQGSNYVLWAQLKMTNSFYAVCSNGESGEKPATEWVAPTNGICPAGLSNGAVSSGGVSTATPFPTGAATPTITPTPTPTATPSTTAGLTGTYFDDLDFSGTQASRTDSTISFNWPQRPHPSIEPDNFSVRWGGYITPPVTGEYEFEITYDGRVSLWVDDTRIIYETNFGNSTRVGSIALVGGRKYPIRIDFEDTTGAALIRLRWDGPSFGSQIVPSSVLNIN